MAIFFLEETAARYADSPAVFHSTGVLSYSELNSRALAAAAHLSAQGIQHGDRVALLASPSLDALVATYAILRIGAVLVPISTRFPAQQISQLLGDVQCRTALISHEYSSYAANFPIQALALEHLANDIAPYAEPWRGSADSDATIVFTSGSTGAPKAALHTLGAHIANARGSQQNIPLGEGDCWLLSLPLFHVGGFAIPVRAFMVGAAIALPAPGAQLADTLRSFPLTHLSLVATQLYRLLRDEENTELLRGLKAVLLGGSAMPRTLIEKALDAELRIHTSYGCTEMASQITTTRKATAGELATSGSLLPHREISIAASGEILVRGATLFRGYVEGTTIRSAVDESGWYRTRDTGFRDSEGRLYVTGRIDNMFISGGENIQPEEIEQALCSIPGILQSLVVPIADEEFGARPVAYIWPADNAPFDESSVRAQISERIARFKLPVRFIVEPPLEENAGKLNREEFRKRANTQEGI